MIALGMFLPDRVASTIFLYFNGSNTIVIIMKRGSSVVECRTHNQVSPGSNLPMVPFRILGVFVLSS